MTKKRVLWCAAGFAASVVALGLQAAVGPDGDVLPDGKGIGTLLNPPAPEVAVGLPTPDKLTRRTNGIIYHGGPVISNGVKMYYIWYGDWSGNTAASILEPLAQNIGNSPYFNINTTYYDSSNPVSANVWFGGATSTSAYLGTSLTDSAIAQIVKDAITNNSLPQDENGVYFVLTAASVTASSGFCTVYCGWHTYQTMTFSSTQKVIKYAFIGNPDRCPSACAAQTSKSPNDNVGADAMASIIAHELEEAATDPQLNAWYDRRGYENADKCAWTFGTTYTVTNGSTANVHLGSKDYLIQQNWVNANGGYCSMSY